MTIFDAAARAGLVAADSSLAPALREKLADLGADTLRHLSSDQADQLAAFIAGRCDTSR